MKLRIQKPKVGCFIGIDNGVSGSIAVIGSDSRVSLIFPMPVKKELNYTKAKGWINRVDAEKLRSIIDPFIEFSKVYLERPMINPKRWKASVSAIRALEATLIVCEQLGLSVQYVDSKEWQKVMLPKGLKSEELKSASLSIGKRMFPSLKNHFKKDADSLLMAEWARRKYSGRV